MHHRGGEARTHRKRHRPHSLLLGLRGHDELVGGGRARSARGEVDVVGLLVDERMGLKTPQEVGVRRQRRVRGLKALPGVERMLGDQRKDPRRVRVPSRARCPVMRHPHSWARRRAW